MKPETRKQKDACMKGLNYHQKRFAKEKIRLFSILRVAIPYARIRNEALKTKSDE